MSKPFPNSKLNGPRPAKINERGPILKTVEYIFRTSRGRPPTMAKDYPHVYHPNNLKNVLIVKTGQQVVSSAAIWTNHIQLGKASLHIGGINAVGTLPDYRKHGLGTQVMQAAQKMMRNLDCHIGLLNTGIVDWYRRVGWEKAGIQYTFRFDRSNICLLPVLENKFQEANDRELEQILSVHHSDKIGGLRTPDLFRQLLKTKKISNIPVVKTETGIIAYLLVACNTIVEWGGPAKSVAGLIRAWFKKKDSLEASTSTRGINNKPVSLTEIKLIVPEVDHPFVTLLKKLKIPHFFGPARMLLVLNPKRILEAFGHTDINVSQKSGFFTLSRGNETDIFSQQQLAKLFFGPERISPFGADLFPLPFCQWTLDCV